MQNPKDLPVSQFRQSFRVFSLYIQIKRGDAGFPAKMKKFMVL